MRGFVTLFLTAFHPMFYGHPPNWMEDPIGRLQCIDCIIRRSHP